jgi:hypothetical protein
MTMCAYLQDMPTHTQVKEKLDIEAQEPFDKRARAYMPQRMSTCAIGPLSCTQALQVWTWKT